MRALSIVLFVLGMLLRSLENEAPRRLEPVEARITSEIESMATRKRTTSGSSGNLFELASFAPVVRREIRGQLSNTPEEHIAAELHAEIDSILGFIRRYRRDSPEDIASLRIMGLQLDRLRAARLALLGASSEIERQDYLARLTRDLARMMREEILSLDQAWGLMLEQAMFVAPEHVWRMYHDEVADHFREAILAHPLVARSSRKKSFPKVPLWAECLFEGLKEAGLYTGGSDAKGWYDAWNRRDRERALPCDSASIPPPGWRSRKAPG